MSLRDDSIIRDERGRIVKGSPGLHRKQSDPPTQSDKQGTQQVNDPSFDDDIIAAAESFGQPRTKKTGRRAWCEALRDQKPTDYAQLLTKALARKGDAATSAASAIPIVVDIVPCPENYFIPGAEAHALWSAKVTGRPQLVIDNNDNAFDTFIEATTFIEVDDDDDDGN
jgi:hypothetical protein